VRDAVVVGAGPIGLVAATLLVDAGWDVVLLEANNEIGGAVRSSTDVDASFVHDTSARSICCHSTLRSPRRRGSRRQQHLHGPVLLLLEHLVRRRALRQRQAVRGEVIDSERILVRAISDKQSAVPP